MASGYALGALFPKKADGSPNLVLSSSYKLLSEGGKYFVRRANDQGLGGILEADIRISTDPINTIGISAFINDYLKPQLTGLDNPSTLGGTIANKYANGGFIWTAGPRSQAMVTLKDLGYRGPFLEGAVMDDAYWSGAFKTGSEADKAKDDEVIKAVTNLDHYKTKEFWNLYSDSETIHSSFDVEALRQNIMNLSMQGMSADLWYPSLLYSYALDGEAPTMPGPVLLLDPGDKLSLNFKNDIRIPGLTDQQLAQAGFIPNSTPGSTASNGLGGTTSTNTHIHGAHVNSVGFGDNVVSRFTTGQQWTTEMDFSPIHAQGSYF